MQRNLKTTALGVLAILGALVNVAVALLDGNPTTNPDWPATYTAIIAGIGLIAAKDAKTI